MDFIHQRKFFDDAATNVALEEIRSVVRQSPLYVPTMRNGSSYRIRMTNCGTAGWISDRLGYRYTRHHPVTGKAWPAIPASILAATKKLAGEAFSPDCCLINFYHGSQARLGVHRDEDEGDATHPIVSFSFGDDCQFSIGGKNKSDPMENVLLSSGDAVLFGGEKRLAWHGVSKIFPGTSSLLRDGGRINLTLRQLGPIEIHEK